MEENLSISVHPWNRVSGDTANRQTPWNWLTMVSHLNCFGPYKLCRNYCV